MNGYMPYNYPMYNPMQRMDLPQASAVPQQAQQTVQPGFICRPVTSKEEALGVQTDFFSPGTLMPDLAHDVVYLKRFNQNTGSSDFLAFALQQDAPKQEPAYASMQDLQELQDRIDQMRADLDKLKKPSGRAVKKDDEQ